VDTVEKSKSLLPPEIGSQLPIPYPVTVLKIRLTYMHILFFFIIICRDNSAGIAMIYGLDDRNSVSGRSKICFFPPQRPDRLWGLPRLLSNGCQELNGGGRYVYNSSHPYIRMSLCLINQEHGYRSLLLLLLLLLLLILLLLF
jgi:hypothetical protein